MSRWWRPTGAPWYSVACPASRWKRVAGRSCTPGLPRRFASLPWSIARYAAWSHRVVRLVQRRHDGGADSPFRGSVYPEGARRDGPGNPPACVRGGALHTTGYVPDTDRLSQQSDRGHRGDGSVFLERQASLIDSRPSTFA